MGRFVKGWISGYWLVGWSIRVSVRRRCRGGLALIVLIRGSRTVLICRRCVTSSLALLLRRRLKGRLGTRARWRRWLRRLRWYVRRLRLRVRRILTMRARGRVRTRLITVL